MTTRKPKGAALLAEWQRDRMTFRRNVVTLEDGRSYGAVMADFQRVDHEGLDAHRHGLIEAPRGHAKTWTGGVEVATELMCGRPGCQCYAVAADEDQARLILTDVKGIFLRSPLLAPLVKPTRTGIEVKATGSKLTVLPSDAPSAYGLRPDLIVCDEMSEWRDRQMWDALYTASGKPPRCRIIVIGTAGWDKTSIAWEVRQIAESEADWYFVSHGQVAPWIDAHWLAQQERTLPPHVFQRLHLNRWVDGAGAFLSAEEVAAIFADFPDLDLAA